MEEGIHPNHFAELLLGSGLVLNEAVGAALIELSRG